jgi:DNA-binding response OmpR family regulator
MKAAFFAARCGPRHPLSLIERGKLMSVYKILLIDDEPDIRECMRMILGRSGSYEFDQAEDGEEGLTKILSQKYDCVVSDIKMPGLDGVSMLKKIRAAGNSVPIVFMSAFADDQFEYQVTDYGAVKLIDKLDMKKVLAGIQEAIRLGEDSKVLSEGVGTDFLDILNNRPV